MSNVLELGGRIRKKGKYEKNKNSKKYPCHWDIQPDDCTQIICSVLLCIAVTTIKKSAFYIVWA